MDGRRLFLSELPAVSDKGSGEKPMHILATETPVQPNYLRAEVCLVLRLSLWSRSRSSTLLIDVLQVLVDKLPEALRFLVLSVDAGLRPINRL